MDCIRKACKPGTKHDRILPIYRSADRGGQTESKSCAKTPGGLTGAMSSHLNKGRLGITDITLRDGHQSILATRMRSHDIASIIPEIDRIGFHSLEVWGGATFDVALRFLNENPWDRPRRLKELAPNTPFQMLLRGQSLVGYRHYPDDVVEAFVRHAADCGIDIFRVFDALNDERNLEASLKAIKACGKHAQLSICYSLTEPKMGGPVYNLDYYTSKAKLLQEMGADSICIKDMAGLIAPDDAYNLITALKAVLHVPIQLHTHYTSGMAAMSCLKAAEAGIDLIDTAFSPLALRSSHPAVEPFTVALLNTERDTGLDLDSLLALATKLESIITGYKDLVNNTRMSIIDTAVLSHQIPGGMISNLIEQLRQSDSLDKLDEVYKEIPRVRSELGYPPLVTPMSQMIGVQAVQNVIVGRYKLVPTQIADYCCGLYGQPPAPIDPQILDKVLKASKRTSPPVTCRPGDLLAPELDQARESIKDMSDVLDDILNVAIYPISGKTFLEKTPKPAA